VIQIEIIIRSIQKEDCEDVFCQMQTFYAFQAVFYPVSEEILRQDLADCVGACPFVEGLVFVDALFDVIAGYAILAKSYSTEYGGVCIWIEDLYIKKDYRHKGIGTQFFTYLETHYRNHTVRFRLEAEPKNKTAIQLYQKCGFEIVPYIELAKTWKKGKPYE